ncbi:hypothetical protein ACFO3U_10740 [Flavobacterium ponti]|uniref:Lipoprotein n=1 Tax=Flavobacterium ponti TaxID=665133 RepID=A0ABV9P863_9FLAO
MKNAIIRTLQIFFLITFISCNSSYNKIEIVFSKSDLKDTIPIKYSLFNLSNKDSVIYKKKIIEYIIVNKKYVFDSLPNGEYILEYSDIKQDTFTKKINLRNNEVYKTKIIFDSLSLEKYYSHTPINNLRNGESYKLFTWGGCIARMESFYKITNLNNKYLLDSNLDNQKILTKDEIKAINKFEAELLALKGKGICNSTGQMSYSISKQNKIDTISEMTCNWNSYNLLMSKLYKRE